MFNDTPARKADRLLGVRKKVNGNKTRQFYSHKTAPSAVWRKYKQN